MKIITPWVLSFGFLMVEEDLLQNSLQCDFTNRQTGNIGLLCTLPSHLQITINYTI